MSRTEETKKLAIQEMREGNLLHTNIAAAVGVTNDTISIWLKNDPEFSENLARAKMDYRKGLFTAVTNRGVHKWDLLRTQFKNEFSDRSEIVGADGESLIPKPIFGGQSVPTSPSDTQSIPTPEEN